MAIYLKKYKNLEYLAARGISVPHGFTTRLGGVSTGTLDSLNLGMNRGDDPANVAENYRRLAQAIGFDPDRLVLTRQIHSDLVRTVTRADCLGLDHRDYPACDALVTADPGVTLVVFTADCTPVLLHDPVTGTVAAAHAGWRGTAADIAGKTAEAMVALGCDPGNIRAAIGPNIGLCHFETDEEVPRAMLDTFGSAAATYIRPRGEKFLLDLKQINALALRRAGVEQIEISRDCTYCRPDRYWSHRYTAGERGAQGALITCKGGTP